MSARAFFLSGSSTNIHCQPWELEPVGAWSASSRHSISTSRGTGRSRSSRLRTERVVVRTSSTERLSAGAVASLIRSLWQLPLRGRPLQAWWDFRWAAALMCSGVAGRWSSLLGGAHEQLVNRDVARASDDVGDGVGDVLRLEGLHRGVPRLVLLADAVADVAGELGRDGARLYGADPHVQGSQFLPEGLAER